MKEKSNKEIIKEIKAMFKLKSKDIEVVRILFSRYLSIYDTKREAQSRTIKEIELYMSHRKNSKNN